MFFLNDHIFKLSFGIDKPKCRNSYSKYRRVDSNTSPRRRSAFSFFYIKLSVWPIVLIIFFLFFLDFLMMFFVQIIGKLHWFIFFAFPWVLFAKSLSKLLSCLVSIRFLLFWLTIFLLLLSWPLWRILENVIGFLDLLEHLLSIWMCTKIRMIFFNHL